jgi:NTP pyrophosphatase (non-canonical NTP hydrolase)
MKAEKLDEYQYRAAGTAIFACDQQVPYLCLGLCEEAGEVAGKIKKTIRDHAGELDAERRRQVLLELGDCLWYLAMIARGLNADLSEVAALNLDKVYSRMQRDKLHGEGDER